MWEEVVCVFCWCVVGGDGSGCCSGVVLSCKKRKVWGQKWGKGGTGCRAGAADGPMTSGQER